jgi:hypothetical protein
MNSAPINHHHIRAEIKRSAHRGAPGRNDGDDSRARAELARLRAENHRLRAENRRLCDALAECSFLSSRKAKPRFERELTAGTGEAPLRRAHR